MNESSFVFIFHLTPTMQNVLAFDAYDVAQRENLQLAFHRHGIPIGDGWEAPTIGTVSIAVTHPLPPAREVAQARVVIWRQAIIAPLIAQYTV
jgi:hypothetical protein